LSVRCHLVDTPWHWRFVIGNLMDRRAFVPDLEPIVNVAYGPTGLKKNPCRGSRSVRRVALRYLHPVNKNKKFLAVVVKLADRFVFAHGSKPGVQFEAHGYVVSSVL
jgi:hypothetical protein